MNGVTVREIDLGSLREGKQMYTLWNLEESNKLSRDPQKQSLPEQHGYLGKWTVAAPGPILEFPIQYI